MLKCYEIVEGLGQTYPLICKENKELFDDVCHHVIVMQDASEKLGVPFEEVMEFFYKGKIKLDLIKRKENELKNDALLRKL